MDDFKCHGELAKENPKGLETLPSPNTFSNNPGQMGAGFSGAGAPGGTAMSARNGALPSRGFTTMPVGGGGALPAHFGGGANRPVANPVLGGTSSIGQASAAWNPSVVVDYKHG